MRVKFSLKKKKKERKERNKNAKGSTSNSLENTYGLWHELFRELYKINVFDTPDSLLVRGK